MSRNKLLGAATSIALIAAIGGTAMAQTAPAVKLPPELEALNLTDVRSDEKRDGMMEVEGRTADGLEIEARLDAEGKLLGVEVDDGTMPQSLIDAILPQAVRDSEILTQFTSIEGVGNRRGAFGVKGEDSAGEDLYALFDQDGRMLRFGRDDDEFKRGKGRHGEMHHGDGPGGPHGHKGGPRHGDHAAGGMPPPPPPPVAPEFEAVDVNKQLTEAGYKDFGFMRIEGPRITLDATNPQGETVTLELDPKGEVLRETAR